MSLLNQILTVPVTDPDDARRRRLLNILLLGVSCVSIAVIIVVLIAQQMTKDNSILVFGSLAMLAGVVLIYFINRSQKSGTLASHMFLILLTIVMAFSDSPAQVAAGRALFSFTIPIIMASVLVGAKASFIYGGLCDLLIIGLAIYAKVEWNLPAVMGFILVALISWLSARSLEQVLKELRLMNRELDERVNQQTLNLTKALAREREEAGRRYAILEGIADGVLVFDTLDHVIIANAALARYLVSRPEDMIGLHYPDLGWLSELTPENKQEVLDLFRNPDQFKSNVRIVLGKNTYSVNASWVVDNDGDQIGKVAVFRDFTQEAEVEKLKSIFLAMVSHELRTPLNAILGYSEIMKEQTFGALTPKQSSTMSRIMNSTRRLLSIVNDLLDQAQLEAGRMHLFKRVFQVTDLFDGLHSMLDQMAKDKGLTLTTQSDLGMPMTLYGDPDRLHQILVNLTANALKFTYKGGVGVRVYSQDTAHWVLEVKDTGVGIPLDQQSRIFEPFDQVEELATREHGGIGLGLTIVKNLVSLMDGEIRLDSQPGNGTTFSIILPIEQP